MGLAQLRQPSRLVADHSALLPVLQLYPLAMSFVYGIDPDSHLLGGWQLDPIKLKREIPRFTGTEAHELCVVLPTWRESG